MLQREVFSLEHRLRSLESQNSELQAAASEGVQPLLRWEGWHAAQPVGDKGLSCCTTASFCATSLGPWLLRPLDALQSGAAFSQ